MTSIRIAIVAHTSRRVAAAELTQRVNGQTFMDDGTLSCEGNHRRAWDWHTAQQAVNPVDWAVTLEDDAQPVDGFRDQLAAALTVAPAPIVSLYLGTDDRQFWQSRIRHTLNNATPSTSWLLSSTLLHAVAVAIRTDVLPLQIGGSLAVDVAVGNWAKRHNHLIAYSVPSLCEHADNEPVVTQRYGPTPQRLTARRAHITGTRARWTSHAAQLGH